MPPMPPTMPGNLAGSPLSPGASPMIAPGGGGGQTTQVRALIKSLMDPLHKALGSVPVESREYKALLRAINALQPVFGSAGEGNLQAAGAQQLLKAATAGQTPMAGVAPGLESGPSPAPKPPVPAPAPPPAMPMAA